MSDPNVNEQDDRLIEIYDNRGDSLSAIRAVFEAGRTAALAEIREQGKLIVDAGELRQLRAGYDTLVEAVEHAPAAIEYLRSVNWGGSVADWERGSDV